MRGKRVLAAAALATIAAATAAQAESLKVTVGQKGFWNADFPEFAKMAGFFKDADLDVEIIYTEGGAATLQPVISGNVDIGMTNGTLGVIAAFVKGAPIRVVSAETTGATDIFWYARADHGIKTLADAAGKTIGFSSPGSSSNLELLALLAQAHISAKPVPTGTAPATMTQVMTGQIDVGWTVPPLALADVEAGKLTIVARGADIAAMRDETVRVNVASVEALKTKRAAIARFIEADARAIDWAYKDPRAMEYFAQGMNVSLAVAKQAVEGFFPKSGFQLGEIHGVQHILDEALETKRIPTAMTPDQIAGLFDIVYPPAKK
ncbi:MAG TPA: ABC transporter substrate-binding protein [Stellaceae bacterium]|nr:ABC transporter substrate-binding protein [Stellaceae bacterium]